MQGDSATSLHNSFQSSVQTNVGSHILRNPEDVLSGTTEAARAATELTNANSNALDCSDPSNFGTSHHEEAQYSSSNTDNGCTGHARRAEQQASDAHSYRQAVDVGKPQHLRLTDSDISSDRQTSSEDDSLTSPMAESSESVASGMTAETSSAILGLPGTPGSLNAHREGTGRRRLKRTFSMVDQEDSSVGMDELDSLDKVPFLFPCLYSQTSACHVNYV